MPTAVAICFVYPHLFALHDLDDSVCLRFHFLCVLDD